MVFRSFDAHDDQCIRQAVQISDGISRLATDMGREDYVVIQRAFQLGAVDYKEHAHVLLSHRRDGWRSDEIDYLIEANMESRKLLAHTLERSPSSVAKQLFEFRLVHGGDEYQWKKDELKLLSQRILHWDAKRIGNALQRTAIDVKHKAIAMGLTHRDVVLTCFRGQGIKRNRDFIRGEYGTALQCV